VFTYLVYFYLEEEEAEEKLFPVGKYNIDTKCIQTPNIYNCLPEAARELYKLSMLATYNT